MANGFDVIRQRQLNNLGFTAGAPANFSGINPQQIYSQFQADQAINPDRGGSEDAFAQPVRSFGGGGQGLDHWGYGGYDVVPLPSGGYGIARGSAAPNGTGFGIQPNVPMDIYDASGKFLGTGQTPAGLNPNDDSMKQFLIGAAMMAGPFAAAIGGAGAAAGAAGGVGGAGGTGAGLAEGAGLGGGYGAGLTGGIGGSLPAGAGFAGSGALDAAGIGGAGYGSAFGMGAGNLALDGAAAAGVGGAVGAAGGAGGAGGVTPQAMGASGDLAGGVPPNPYLGGADGAAGGAGGLFGLSGNGLGALATAAGGLLGSQGVNKTTTQTAQLPPYLQNAVAAQLIPGAQSLLTSQSPTAQQYGQQLGGVGSTLLNTPLNPNEASNPYLKSIADDMQRRTQLLLNQNNLAIQGNAVASGGLGGSRQGVAQGLAAAQAADSLQGNVAGLYGNAYQQDAQRNLQAITLGSGLMSQGLNTPWQPFTNASQLYTPYTGFGTTTQNQSQGGGAMGALGGALGAATVGHTLGWW